jgi:hypothetical protein
MSGIKNALRDAADADQLLFDYLRAAKINQCKKSPSANRSHHDSPFTFARTSSELLRDRVSVCATNIRGK